MDKLIAKSALHPVYKEGTYGIDTKTPLQLEERRGLTMLNLVVWDNDAVNQVLNKCINVSLPEPGKASASNQSAVLWIGPGRYLIVSPSAALYQSMTEKLDDQQGAIQDLTSARTVIRMTGDMARKVMVKGLNLDLSEAGFSQDQVILSSFDHHYPGVIHNVSSEQNQFDIYITRSFALSFWEWLCDASLEFGYQVVQPAQHVE